MLATLLAILAIGAMGSWLYMQADDSLRSDLRTRQVTDITGLQATQVGRVATPKHTAELAALLRDSQGPVSIGGARCSMGGQIASPGSLHLDMRQMNDVLKLSPARREVTVESGITWRQLQSALDRKHLSVKIMQTYANFTVGGTLSVNAHGRYMGLGPVVMSVKRLKLVLADGRVVEASPTQERELFYGAIGGYGGVAVIAEATLEVTPNHKVERLTELMDASDYANYFRDTVRRDKDIVFHNADLHPPKFESVRAVSWQRTDKALTQEARLIPEGDTYVWTPRLVNQTVVVPFGHALRKHLLEPVFYAQDAVTWRNHEASYDVAEIEPADRRDHTYVLREYFLPVRNFDLFLAKMRAVFQSHHVEVVNVSIRHALPDPGTLLAWAREEVFAFVVYYRQGTDASAKEAVTLWSRALIDAALALQGTYYLPYQVQATPEQFARAYPRFPEFRALKRRVDPDYRFRNALWTHYIPPPADPAREAAAAHKAYAKPEGQSLLTVPEWYLVFNPEAYADHLEARRPADAFPFLASVQEYWSLYKRTLRLHEGIYPDNTEYLTMLRVIGVSTTAEYLVKAAYEATVGRLTRHLSSGQRTEEARLIAQAHRAYSDFIHQEPFYAFAYAPWVGKVWQGSTLGGPDLLRRTERKLAFTFEFGVKALYAQLIKWATESAYETPRETVRMLVRDEGDGSWRSLKGVRLITRLSEGRALVELPRWGGFTALLPKLLQRGLRLIEVAGNDDIALTVRARSPEALAGEGRQLLFDGPLAADKARRRVALFARVDQLHLTLEALAKQGAELEHIYDY